MSSRLLPLRDIPTISGMYRSSKLSAAASAPVNKPSKQYNSMLSLVRYDITKLQVSAIVNAANNSLLGGGGVDGAIHRAAGPELMLECVGLGGCDTGSAKMTDGYNLPCDWIIHAVGPVYPVENRRQPGRAAELLTGCYKTSLDLAGNQSCQSIAFSAISTGVYGFPSTEAAETVLKEVRRWLDEKADKNFRGVERIIFCCFEAKDVRAYEALIPKYFPPTEEDVPADKQAAEESGAQEVKKSMPSPPKTEPLKEGERSTKRQKVTNADESGNEEAVGSVDKNGGRPASPSKEVVEEEGWEVVDTPAYSQDVSPPENLQTGNAGESQEMMTSSSKDSKAERAVADSKGQAVPGNESAVRSRLASDW